MAKRPIRDIKFNVRESITRNISRGKVVINNGVANLFLSVPKIDKGGTGGAGGISISFVLIITAPSYPSNSDISVYTVTSDIDNPSGLTFEIDAVVGFGKDQDMRDFIPWLIAGTIAPIITITEDEVETIYFWQTFTHVGDTKKSLTWLEDDTRAAAVFR